MGGNPNLKPELDGIFGTEQVGRLIPPAHKADDWKRLDVCVGVCGEPDGRLH